MDFKTAFDPFRAARHGIASLKLEPTPVIAGGFLMFALKACQGGGSGRFPSSTGGSGADGIGIALMLALAGVGMCMAIAVMAARAFIEPGTYRVGERLTVDGACGLDTLFSGKDVWLSMIGYGLLRGLIMLGVLVVTLLPGGLLVGLAFFTANGGDPSIPLVAAGALIGTLLAVPTIIFVALGLQLGSYAISIDRMAAMEALDFSWTKAKGNRLSLLWFDLITGAANLAAVSLGVMTCCVGLLVTMPVTAGVIFCAQANAYLMLTRDDYEDFALVKDIGAA